MIYIFKSVSIDKVDNEWRLDLDLYNCEKKFRQNAALVAQFKYRLLELK